MKILTGMICLTLLQIGGVVGRFSWGITSDKFFGQRRGGILAGIGILPGLFSNVFGLSTSDTSILFLLVLSFLLGATTQGWNGIFVIMVSELVDKNSI